MLLGNTLNATENLSTLVMHAALLSLLEVHGGLNKPQRSYL